MRKCGMKEIMNETRSRGKLEEYPGLLGDPQLLQIRNSFEYFRPRGREEEEEEDGNGEEGRWEIPRVPAQHRRERRGGR
jgi:hypothetical protein